MECTATAVIPSVEQGYHLEPPRGLLNDPVGLAHFKGRYHVFFQWNPAAKDHTHKEWGHFSSADLVDWTFHESPLRPDRPYDIDGVYSGSCCEVDGVLHAYYTGNRKVGGRVTTQCLAVSDDGISFEKVGPVLSVPEGYTQHMRDPRVLAGPDGLSMLLGAQRADTRLGEIVEFTSVDGRAWEAAGVVGRSSSHAMVECPERLSFEDGTDVLVYCLQDRDPVTDEALDSVSVYRPVPAGTGGPVNLDEGWAPVDAGFDLYAPQVLRAPDGRLLLFGWMNRLNDGQERALAARAEHVHCLTLPRELSWDGGRLIQRPLAEAYGLFEETGRPVRGRRVECGRRWLLTLFPCCQSFDIDLDGGELGLSYDAPSGEMLLWRRDWTGGGWEWRQAQAGEVTRAEVFADTSSVEVFVNGGELVLSARTMPRSHSSSIKLVRFPGEGIAEIRAAR